MGLGEGEGSGVGVGVGDGVGVGIGSGVGVGVGDGDGVGVVEAAPTLITSVPVFSPFVASISAVPLDLAVITPLLSTVATLGVRLS